MEFTPEQMREFAEALRLEREKPGIKSNTHEEMQLCIGFNVVTIGAEICERLDKLIQAIERTR